MKMRVFSGVLWGGVLLLSAGTIPATACEEPATPVPPAIDTVMFDLGGNDPIEGFNRSMFEVNNVFLRWVYRPVGIFYGSIMPREGVNMVNRFADNVGFPPRMLSCFCQAKWEAGGIEFLRFLTNTTVGIGGLFDPATPWFGLERQDEDFGQAFASWGIGPGCALILPGSGAGNVRDTTGLIFDYALDPKTYFYGAQATTMLHAGLDPYPIYEKLRWASRDSYWTSRQLRLLLREKQLTDWKPAVAFAAFAEVQAETPVPAPQPAPSPEEQQRLTALDHAVWQSPVIDTLKVQWFRPDAWKESMWVNISPWNTDFDNLAWIREVQVLAGTDCDPMPYRYWAPKEKNPKAPLAVILPGLGGHCTGGMAVPLAELFYQHGYAVVALSSSFNWEFAATALPGGIPGCTPVDAEATREAIACVLRDLADDAKLEPESLTLAGYSQGALHTLYIAQQEAADGDKLEIERYIAINPPVEMYYGLQTLDGFYQAGAAWSREEAVKRIVNAAGVYLMAGEMPVTEESLLPIDEGSARFLVGFSYRMTLTELLASIHKRGALPAIATPYHWSDQTALYREIIPHDYAWYVSEVLLPYYSARWKRPVTLEELNRLSGLQAVGAELASNDKVFVLTNWDDFLLTAEDRDYLRTTFGDRLTMFNHGGHLGSLYHPVFRKALADLIITEAPEQPPTP